MGRELEILDGHREDTYSVGVMIKRLRGHYNVKKSTGVRADGGVDKRCLKRGGIRAWHNGERSVGRFEDMLAVYKEIAPNCKTSMQAFRLTVCHPAPRFYIGHIRAVTCVSSIIREGEGWLDKFPGWKKKLYMEIFRRVMKRIEDGDTEGGLRGVCIRVLDEPAPEFYLCWRSFAKYFYNRRKEGRI